MKLTDCRAFEYKLPEGSVMIPIGLVVKMLEESQQMQRALKNHSSNEGWQAAFQNLEGLIEHVDFIADDKPEFDHFMATYYRKG